ncbi:unnamed protein product [Rotaria sp. Silwood1]|nr:unnamed protein product [Rotaria sp. Silwood1]CAF1463107.1 unnamed protein product [Rotaria sp. Silwood1]CAF1486369.1 unnamed protein product [Rotaria sp. Silwood1]
MFHLLTIEPALFEDLIEVEAGIQWSKLIDYLVETQKYVSWTQQWDIAQKQAAADRFSIDGTLACNAHSRGLKMQPIVGDVESFTLIDAQTNFLRCSRQENEELIGLIIGSYGLFGVIYSVILRLTSQQKIELVVEVITVDNLSEAFEQSIQAGFLYGDFQFSTGEKLNDFLYRGVFFCYRPVDPSTEIVEGEKELSKEHCDNLYYLSHADKAEGFRQYATYYLSTSGQIYASDTDQLSIYLDDYHHKLDHRLGLEE